jgi:pimeloyl-ACP methyl ester carboxylesterase
MLANSMRQRLFAKSTLEHRPELVAQVLKMILTTKPAGISAALRGMAERPDMSDLLPQIRVPTLLIVGEEDAITPADEMRRMAASIPRTEFVTVPRAGHMAPLENPHVVNDALRRFLRGLNGG